MKIEIRVPGVMKWQHIEKVDIEKTTKLPEIKEKIFEQFWKVMSQHKSKHGSVKDITLKALKDYKYTEVTNETILWECIERPGYVFEAFFNGH